MNQTTNPNIHNKKSLYRTHGRKPGQIIEDFKWFDEYKDFLQGKMVPVSEAFIDRLARDYTEWAINDETALIMSQFPLKKSIPPETFVDWCHQHQGLAQAHTIALAAVGNRRELGGLNKKMSENMVSFTMPTYDKGWKELQEWRASMRDLKPNANEQKVIVIEKISMPEEKPVPIALPDKQQLTPEEVAGHASMKGVKDIREGEEY